MRTLKTMGVAGVIAAAALGGSATAATGARTVAFSGTYAGTATVKVNGTQATAVALGKGTGTLMGASKIGGSAKADTSSPPCAIWYGLGSISSTRGTLKISVLPGARGCASQDDQNNVTVSGQIKVAGGTGKFAKAKGLLKFTGKLDRAAGKFSVRLTGALTV